MRRNLAAGVAGLLACLSAHALASRDFVCDSGARLQVQFLKDAARLTLPDGRAWSLPQRRMGSGFAYAGKEYELRGKGNEIDVTGPKGMRAEHCTVLPLTPQSAMPPPAPLQ